MSLLAALSLAVLAQGGPSYLVGGEPVQVQLPKWEVPSSVATLAHDGQIFGFVDGRLVGRGTKSLGWDDLPPATVGTEPAQPILVDLVTRVDTLSEGEYLLQRQATLFSDDTKLLKQEAALFCHLVAVATQGKTKFEVTWRVDEQLRFLGADPDEWRQRAPSDIAPDVNATAEKPSSGLGPFASIFVLHPTFGRSIGLTSLDGKPLVTIPAYAYLDRSRPGQLARAMFDAWVRAQSASGDSFELADPIGGGPLTLDRLGDWIGSNWTSLPIRSQEALAKGLGGTKLTRTGHTWNLTVDGGAIPVGDDFGQAGLLLKSRSSKVLAVRPTYRDLFETKLGKAPTERTVLGGEAFVLFDGAGVTVSTKDAEILGLSPTAPAEDAAKSIAFSPGEAEKLPRSGSFEAKTVADPERGSVGEIRELAIRRQGWIRLVGASAGQSAAATFWLKPRGAPWPLNVVVLTSEGARVFRLFGRQEPQPGTYPRYDEGTAVDLEVKAEPIWQKIAVPLGTGTLFGVYLATPANADGLEMQRSTPPSVLIDDVEIGATDALTPTATPAAAPDEETQRAKHAHTTSDQAVLLKLLADPSDAVKLNAADRFRTIKNAGAIPELTKIARDVNPRLAQAGSLALGAQESSTAIAALRYNFQSALGDFSKQFGAQALPPVNERRILAELSVGLNARRPEARAEIVRALARQPFREASLVMMTFLNDLEATVRKAVIESLPAKDETVLKRVVGIAQNDPSDDVRAAAYRRLKEWGAPEFSGAVKDPSSRVRAVQ